LPNRNQSGAGKMSPYHVEVVGTRCARPFGGAQRRPTKSVLIPRAGRSARGFYFRQVCAIYIALPEPGTMALADLGGLSQLFFRRRK
jgi:hypothetical protein